MGLRWTMAFPRTKWRVFFSHLLLWSLDHCYRGQNSRLVFSKGTGCSDRYYLVNSKKKYKSDKWKTHKVKTTTFANMSPDFQSWICYNIKKKTLRFHFLTLYSARKPLACILCRYCNGGREIGKISSMKIKPDIEKGQISERWFWKQTL